MTLANLVAAFGIALAVVIALVVGWMVGVAYSRQRPRGRHHQGDDLDHWQHIASMPDRYEQVPPHPDGGTA